MKRRKGASKAKVAASAKAVRMAYRMMGGGREYSDNPRPPARRMSRCRLGQASRIPGTQGGAGDRQARKGRRAAAGGRGGAAAAHDG